MMLWNMWNMKYVMLVIYAVCAVWCSHNSNIVIALYGAYIFQMVTFSANVTAVIVYVVVLGVKI